MKFDSVYVLQIIYIQRQKRDPVGKIRHRDGRLVKHFETTKQVIEDIKRPDGFINQNHMRDFLFPSNLRGHR